MSEKSSKEWTSDGVRKEDIIGTRTFETSDDMERILVYSLLVVFLTGIFALWVGFSNYWEYDGVTDPFMTVFGLICTVGYLFVLIWARARSEKRRKNNKSRDPTIAVREDGVFILYHADGKKDHLNDKIIDVDFSGSSVTFTLEAPSGQRYMMSVKHVLNSLSAVTRIKNMLAYKDDKFQYTNYEKAMMFCQYCGYKVSPADRACPHCGGRQTH